MEQQQKMVEYFSSLSYQVPVHTNPADYFCTYACLVLTSSSESDIH
jgi:hypothetical protein